MQLLLCEKINRRINKLSPNQTKIIAGIFGIIWLVLTLNIFRDIFSTPDNTKTVYIKQQQLSKSKPLQVPRIVEPKFHIQIQEYQQLLELNKFLDSLGFYNNTEMDSIRLMNPRLLDSIKELVNQIQNIKN